MDIKLGSTIAKPVVTQAQCDAYTAMADAVTAHNTACGVGSMRWRIEDKEHCYAIAEDGLVQPPTAEELAAQEEERKKQEAKDKLPETVAALQEDSKTLKKENEMLKQCLLEMSEIVYA
jgi:hypothetical protein|nr:MAG TPA: Transcription factor HY5 leucine zipper, TRANSCRIPTION.0A [Caudoviricetes sp.]